MKHTPFVMNLIKDNQITPITNQMIDNALQRLANDKPDLAKVA